MRPTARLMMSHPAHFISLGFGAGLSPWAPGTMGTLLAWALYPLIRTPLSEFVFLALLADGVYFLEGPLTGVGNGSSTFLQPHLFLSLVFTVFLGSCEVFDIIHLGLLSRANLG